MNEETPEAPAQSAPVMVPGGTALLSCPRCGRYSPVSLGRCLYCRAPRAPGEVASPPPELIAMREAESSGRRMGALCWIFALMLAVNVGFCWYAGQHAQEGVPDEPTVRALATGMSWAEAVDTLLVVWIFIKLRKVVAPAAGMGRRKRMAWLIFPVALAGLLALNIGYHKILLDLFEIRPEIDYFLSSGHHRIWLLALCCVQPAVIEELFCRRLAFDFFADHTGVGTAAFASAVMFAAMHTAALVSFPYFVAFGIAMAWLRWWSGSLALPMLVHFAHNFLISTDVIPGL